MTVTDKLRACVLPRMGDDICPTPKCGTPNPDMIASARARHTQAEGQRDNSGGVSSDPRTTGPAQVCQASTTRQAGRCGKVVEQGVDQGSPVTVLKAKAYPAARRTARITAYLWRSQLRHELSPDDDDDVQPDCLQAVKRCLRHDIDVRSNACGRKHAVFPKQARCNYTCSPLHGDLSCMGELSRGLGLHPQAATEE